MANDHKQIALKRLEKFQDEGKEQGMPALSAAEYTRLKTFFINDLSKKYGSEIISVSFDDLLSDLMGSGINTIETYIQSNFNDFPLFGEEEQPENSEELNAPTSEEDHKENIPLPPEDRSLEKQTRTRKRSAGMDDIFWTPTTSAKAATQKVKKIKSEIARLEKDRDILHRQFSLYRPDYAIIQGVIEYGRKGETPLEYNGLSLDNQQNVLHAALECLIQNLQSSNNTNCFKNIKKYRDMSEDEINSYNDKIAKLEKDLQKLLGK